MKLEIGERVGTSEGLCPPPLPNVDAALSKS